MTKDPGLYYVLTGVTATFNGKSFTILGLLDSRVSGSYYSYYCIQKMIQMRVKTSDKSIYSYSQLTQYILSNVTAQVAYPKSGSWFNGFVKVNTDGVMEAGKFLDFHASNDTTDDYNTRLACNTSAGSNNTVTLPTASGTLALTSDIDAALGDIATILTEINGE